MIHQLIIYLSPFLYENFKMIVDTLKSLKEYTDWEIRASDLANQYNWVLDFSLSYAFVFGK